jgi:hypothetical protein
MGFLVFLIILAIIFGIVYLKQNADVNNRCKGKNDQQKQVIKYLYGGFMTFGKMSDNEYDRLVAKVRDGLNLKQRALEKIGIDEDELKEIEPVFFEGYARDNAFIGKQDGKLRSTWYETAWLFFSDTQVYMSKYCWDMESDSKRESTEEYFYKDITNFNTAAETVEAFKRTGCSGDKVEKENREFSSFSLVVPGDKFYCSTSNAPNAEASVSAMKQKLREKKTQS